MALKGLNRQQMEYAAIALVLVLSIVFAIVMFNGKNKSSSEALSREEYEKRVKEVNSPETQMLKKADSVLYEAPLERSPFRSIFDKENVKEEIVVLPAMELQGMIWNSLRPQAIINNSVYDIGDVVLKGENPGDDVVLEKITRDGIDLLYRGKHFIVKPKVI